MGGRILTEMLGISRKDAVAIVGCGGKTALMHRLAAENRDLSVLIGTTTLIYRPAEGLVDEEIGAFGEPSGRRGVALAAGGERNGKLLPLPDEKLAQLTPQYDYTFLECDGSRGLPLKGWAAFEPVVPSFIAATIGVAVIRPLGERITEQNTLRLSRFCAITGAEPGEVLALRHIAAMISQPDGMMRQARGRQILFINQIETPQAFADAEALVRLLPEPFLDGVSRIVCGSLHRRNFCILWEA